MNQKTRTMFISYLEGNTSLANEKILMQSIKNHPDSIDELSELRKVWYMTTFIGKLNNDFIEKEWDKFYTTKKNKGKRSKISNK